MIASQKAAPKAVKKRKKTPAAKTGDPTSFLDEFKQKFAAKDYDGAMTAFEDERAALRDTVKAATEAVKAGRGRKLEAIGDAVDAIERCVDALMAGDAPEDDRLWKTGEMAQRNVEDESEEFERAQKALRRAVEDEKWMLAEAAPLIREMAGRGCAKAKIRLGRLEQGGIRARAASPEHPGGKEVDMILGRCSKPGSGGAHMAKSHVKGSLQRMRTGPNKGKLRKRQCHQRGRPKR